MYPELKNLPAAERIKRLKELEKQKKKEIEEAHTLLKESEAELGDQIKFKEKVPIAQVAKEDLKDTSLEEKEIIKVHRGIQEQQVELVEEAGTAKQVELEELVADAKGQQQSVDVLYQAAMSMPLKDIYTQMSQLYALAEQKGYVNQYEMAKVQYLSDKVEEKRAAADAGNYSMTAELERKAGLTTQFSERLKSLYKGSKWND